VRVLITGASGFIGGHLAEALCRRGDDVFCLVRKTSLVSHLRHLPARLVSGDVTDAASLCAAVRGMDYVFHLAGIITSLDPREYEAINVQGTQNLVRAVLQEAPGLKRFIFVSSISAAGPSLADRAFSETDEPRPVSEYGQSKLAAERIVLAAGSKLPVTIIRPPNVLGPRQRELQESIRLIRRRIVPVLGNGRPQTSLADVDDVVRALVLSAENPRAVGETYFITDGKTYAWREIIMTTIRELGLRPPFLRVPFAIQYAVSWIEERKARRRRRRPRLTREQVLAARNCYLIYNGTKIRQQLGFEPVWDMPSSIRRTVDWILQQEMNVPRKSGSI
jgi:nucleoside-diphosphate-sugar epimerase